MTGTNDSTSNQDTDRSELVVEEFHDSPLHELLPGPIEHFRTEFPDRTCFGTLLLLVEIPIYSMLKLISLLDSKLPAIYKNK